MRDKEVSAALWEKLEPLLPEAPPRSAQGGRPRVDDRRALNGILFVLRTGIGWEHLPQELGYGSGMTCWRRLRAWQADCVICLRTLIRFCWRLFGDGNGGCGRGGMRAVLVRWLD